MHARAADVTQDAGFRGMRRFTRNHRHPPQLRPSRLQLRVRTRQPDSLQLLDSRIGQSRQHTTGRTEV